ncbi:MAG: PAS domain-containing sensor histidine kinase [Rhodoferax sp.]|uniref:PAS domain-containing sensor histidine kinase n=1 Tax=Rhodoferax sp. TaxID=50421 RepID=UPI00301624D5
MHLRTQNADSSPSLPSDTVASEPVYRLLFEHNPTPMWVYDVKSLCMLAVNDAALKKYGYSRPEFLGLNVLDVHHKEDAVQVQTQFEGPSSDLNQVAPWVHRHRSGASMEVETETEEMTFEGGPARLVLVKDVTEQRRAEQEHFDLVYRLQEEQETLAAVVNSTSNAVISIDAYGCIDVFNPAAQHIFGYPRDQMKGQTLELLMPERFREAHPAHRNQFAAERETSRMMGMGVVKGLRSDGAELSLEVTIAQVTVKGHQVQIAVLRDVTDRLRATAIFEQSRAQLSELTQKLMTQEKSLVKRLAQSLHDQLGQTMAAVRMAHETIIALQGNAISPSVDRLQTQMGSLIAQAIRQVRQVLVDLRPPLLEEQGLAAALDNELRNRSLTQPKMDIAIHVSPEVALLRWPTEVEYAAFMVAREAVENALRHSGASSVDVELTGSPGELRLEVTDNGYGLVDGAPQKMGHLGMLGMQERAHSISATVTVNSDEEHGTRIIFSWQPF